MAAMKKTDAKTVAVETAKVLAEVKEVKAAPAAEKAEAKKAPAGKEAAPAKAPAAKRGTASKKTAASAAKKAPAKKTAEIKASVYVQYAGGETSAEALLEAAKKAYIAAGHKEEDIKTLDVYIKPEEHTAYYAVNGEGSDDYKIVY